MPELNHSLMGLACRAFYGKEVLKGFSGILYIGDLHGSSTRVGRRIDDYAAVSLDKLSQAAKICREQNLLPVSLGDLFHRARENSLTYLSQMWKILSQEFHVPLIVIAGSHDRVETRLTDKDALHLLNQMGFIYALDRKGLAIQAEINGAVVNLWATPAGSPIPDSVDGEAGQFNVMVTHHDLDFNGPYPNCHEIKEIQNCDMVVNGHMHKACDMVIKGTTVWHNPGSIMRVSIKEKTHKPAVSLWTPAHGVNLQTIPLVYKENVFDLTGKEVFAADPRELKEALPKGLRISSFAGKLRAAAVLAASRTED
uniref:metallophosphoesterase family protein n=1 Tax=Comamonas thiooxydans TaxID=363952 RepID=UPI000B409202